MNARTSSQSTARLIQTQRIATRQLPLRKRCDSRNDRKTFAFAGGIQSPVAVRDWMVECVGSLHVLQIMWMAHPNQADRPQGAHHVSGEFLVANDLGMAQAGNRAGKTRHDLQWWDTETE